MSVCIELNCVASRIAQVLTQGRIRVVSLWLSDIACIYFAWFVSVLCYWLLGRVLESFDVQMGVGGYSPWYYLSFWSVPLAFTIVNSFLDLYQGSWMYPAAPLPPVEEMRRLVLSSFLTHIGVIAFFALAYQTTEGVSRVVVVASGLISAIAAQSFRNCVRCILYRCGIGQIPVFLAGAGDVARYVAGVIGNDPYIGMRIEGYFDGIGGIGVKNHQHSTKSAALERIAYLGTLLDIVPEAKKRNVKILLACQGERLFRRQADEFAQWFTHIEFLPTVQAFPVCGSRPISYGGAGGLEMVNQTRMKTKRLQKCILDMFFAFCAFVILSPLFIVIPILIKLTSKGSVFYRQKRLGLHGKSINVWKFRSMFEDAEMRLAVMLNENPKAAEEWKRNFKFDNDPRITPLGRLLRKTSLDELPQLFNVLSGEMALIGPRPIVEAEVSYYAESYSTVSSVKPGITGLWQVSGRSDTDYSRRVALDVYYVLNWSLWMDIWILIRTVYAVVFMRGAR